MRSSDWSSDVCSSDLPLLRGREAVVVAVVGVGGEDVVQAEVMRQSARLAADHRDGAVHLVDGDAVAGSVGGDDEMSVGIEGGRGVVELRIHLHPEVGNRGDAVERDVLDLYDGAGDLIQTVDA